MFDPRAEYGNQIPIEPLALEGEPELFRQLLLNQARKELPAGIPFEIRAKLDRTGVAWYYHPHIMIDYLEHTDKIVDETQDLRECRISVKAIYGWLPKEFTPPVESEFGGYLLVGRYIA